MKNRILLILCVFFASAAAFSQDRSFKPMKDNTQFIAKFDENVKQLKSIKSEFVQEKHISFMDDSIVSKGLFRYKKENRVRLEYTFPFSYLLVLNGGKVYIKDGGKVNKYDSKSIKIFKQINDMLINTMNGSFLRSKDYTIRYFENESSYFLELLPVDKSVAELIAKINIYIDKKSLTVNKLKIIEKSEDFTNINFHHIQQNVEIKDEEFIIK